MSHVPLPVRVAMGLVISAVEQARKLPEQLAELPVTAASKAVQAGMRVQQRVTELAIRGDQVLALLRPVEDTPPWAKFDEDGEPPRPGTETTADASNQANSGAPIVPARGTEVDEADVAQALTPPPADGKGPGEGDVTRSTLAEYDEMSLAQLRSRLRGYSLDQLEELLAHERAQKDRPAFVTLLTNRISTVRSQPPETP
ncbi:MAG TPA: lipid droplet-associated protein [Pseudonocardiaceae bacterium]|nr:lipid droplet-associated protein [Pseudonocardiaceae bacterium]